jgi:hypothetical protein
VAHAATAAHVVDTCVAAFVTARELGNN